MDPNPVGSQNLWRRGLVRLSKSGVTPWGIDLNDLCEDTDSDPEDDEDIEERLTWGTDNRRGVTQGEAHRQTSQKPRKPRRKKKHKKRAEVIKSDKAGSEVKQPELEGNHAGISNEPHINKNLPAEVSPARPAETENENVNRKEIESSSEETGSTEDDSSQNDEKDKYLEEPLPRLARLRLQEVMGLRKYYTDLDSFKRDLLREMDRLKIVQQEAEIKVLVRLLMEDHRPEGAVLYVTREVDPEPKVKTMAGALLHHGALLPETDLEKMAIYHAVCRGHCQVLKKLLKIKGMPQSKERQFRLLQKALEGFQQDYDEIAAVLITHMSKSFVRHLFCSFFGKPPRLNFHDLLQSSMQKTILAVLDCLIEMTEDGKVKMYYQMLESDKKGHTPQDSTYNTSTQSALHVIADTENKDAVHHDVIRELLNRKWEQFCRKIFFVFAVRFLVSLILMTFVLVVASGCKDPLVYDSPLQYVRGIVEVVLCIDLLISLILIIIRGINIGPGYYRVPKNWLNLASLLVPLAVVPLRFYATKQSWPVFGIGYFLWTMRIFKYSSASRSLGIMARTFSGFLTTDIVQFLVLFSVVLLAFSGTMLAGLTYEGASGRYWETRTYWTMILTGIRTLVEQSVIINYVGEEGLGPFCVVVMLLFLLITLVVMVNILVAQLSATYDSVLADAERALELDRLKFITRRERDPCTDKRKELYIRVEDVTGIFKKNKKSAERTSGKAAMLKEIKDKLEQQDLHLHSLGLQMHHLLETTHTMQQQLDKHNSPKR